VPTLGELQIALSEIEKEIRECEEKIIKSIPKKDIETISKYAGYLAHRDLIKKLLHKMVSP
jgi:hypothetical protein